jgi:hypothetical protein
VTLNVISVAVGSVMEQKDRLALLFEQDMAEMFGQLWTSSAQTSQVQPSALNMAQFAHKCFM